jgi:hypothetical protein
MARASADMGFMFIAYNLRRIGNILTGDLLKEYLRILISMILAVFGLLRGVLVRYPRPAFMEQASWSKNQPLLKLA